MRQALRPTAPGEGGVFHAGTAPSREKVAAAFPQLEILELIGRGGMGAVFRARQPKLNRLVALKVIPLAETPTGQAFAARFEREGVLLARLHHPNIVAIYDSGRAGEFLYLLMEHVDGVNLRQAMAANRFTPAEALAIVPKICEALQYAHDEGVLHRDIKPENILLNAKGRVKLADFGIAKVAADPEAAGGTAGEGVAEGSDVSPLLTQAGVALGTPRYMAPEQAADPQGVDHRADIYSLGVVFYELLTGELPGAAFALPSQKTAVDQRVDAIVRQALEKERELRQRSAQELKTQVETAAQPPATPAHMMNMAAARHQKWEYISRGHLFGLPLLHVASGTDPQTGRASVACGVVAVGDVARGVIAFGGRAYGVFAFGGIAVGVVALGGVAFGLVALGGLAVALLLAIGGVAVGALAAGGMAAGWQAIGGGAYGYLAAGGSATGAHVFRLLQEMPVSMQWLRSLLMHFSWMWVLWVPLILLGILTQWWAGQQAAAGKSAHHPALAQGPRSPWWGRLGVACWVFAVPFWILSFVWLHLMGSEKGGWNPVVGEAVLVIGTWAAALLFPALAVLLGLIARPGLREKSAGKGKFMIASCAGLIAALIVGCLLIASAFVPTRRAYEKALAGEAEEKQIMLAIQAMKIAKTRHETGTAPLDEVIEAEIKAAVAQARGDALAVAEAERLGAARLVEIAQQHFEAGQEPQKTLVEAKARLARWEAEAARLRLKQ